MSKIATFREKIMFIKQNKINSLQQLAEVADIFDKSYAGPHYKWHESQQDNRFNNNKTFDTNRGYGNRQFGKTFNPEGTRHRNWGIDSSNQNNNRSQDQRQNQNRMYNNRAINALALDSRSNRQNMRCNHCSRTNHMDNECYYKPVSVQSNARNKQDGQIRNQGNQNNWMPRRNENVRYIEDQEIEGEFEQPTNQGITFNRQSEFVTENGNNQKETRVKEIEGNQKRQHSICATFVSKFPDSCEEPTGYGFINGIPSKVTRDTAASCSFVSSKWVKQENYTGENALVTFAEGDSQIRPMAVLPVDTPFFTGQLTCIVSDDAKQDLLLGNYNGSKEDKIGGCKFEKRFDDSEIKKKYDARIKMKIIKR